MKKLLYPLVLLWLAYAHTAHGQALTLDQLIYLEGKESVDVDAYLRQRGWHLGNAGNAAPPSDSLTQAYWLYLDTKRKKSAEFVVTRQPHKPPQVQYAFNNMVVFDAVRAKTKQYNMEFYEQWEDGGIGSSYMGATYRVLLHVSNIQAGWYLVGVERHEMVKLRLKTIGDDSKTDFHWFTEKQAKELQDLLDARRRETVTTDSTKNK